MGKSSAMNKRVVKAMSVFGGVQIVNIICSVVRSKLVAIWIGAAGVGLFNVFNSAVDMICCVAGMGISRSGSRDVASCHSEAGQMRIAAVVRRWSYSLGFIGAVVTFLIAPLLSRWSFDDDSHAWAFRWLSITVFFLCATQGEQAILQGMSKFKRLAKASMFAAVSSILISVPLFYFFRIDSIVPVVICSGLCAITGMLIWRQPVNKAERGALSFKDAFKQGKSMISLGMYITASDIISLSASYILISLLTTEFDSAYAGLFSAGFLLVNRYVGLVFNAISMEYFPRLASVKDRRFVTRVFVSHEMKLALCVLIPIIAIFIVFSPLIVNILYSDRFEPILPFIEIGIVGTMFRAISWCMAFTIVARGDGKAYLFTEAVSATAYVLINLLVIKTWGLSGMGFAYIGWYFLYTVVVGLIYFRKYHLTLNHNLLYLIAFAIVSTVGVLVLSMNGARIFAGCLIPVLAFASYMIFVRGRLRFISKLRR